MWYLIIPPLVFLGSLWLLLFFLSRRVTDPALQDRLADARREEGRSILFIKEETGLRILEKLNQRFKVFFLKLHNASGTLSQSLKERRERFRELKRKSAVSQPVPVEAQPGRGQVKKPFWMRFRKDEESDTAVGEARISSSSMDEREGTPLFSGSSPLSGGQEDSQKSAHQAGGTGDSVSSGIFDRIRRREPRERPKRLVSEEDLIGKIAKNPKDAVAYEELGDYYMETKQLEDAKACYRQVIKLLPMNREVKDKVRKLERLLTRAGR